MNIQRLHLRTAVMGLLLIVAMGNSLARADETVKVFILAGQSNMEGKAAVELMNHQATDPKTRDFFAHFRDGDQWKERDDVYIKFLNRKGPLTIGYGSPKKTGPELEFGWMMGDHFDEPVLLIKAAWGGHSLYQKFRPPSAGMPSQERLDEELANARQRVQNNNEKNNRNDPLPTMEEIKEPYGISYRNMMDEVKSVQANYAEMFPELAGKKLEMAGFFWFQGFNDQFGEYAPKEYKENMEMFIKDVRKDLSAPELPFVIAAIGTGGSSHPADHPVMVAQLAMNDVPEFKRNVIAFKTNVLVDKVAEEAFPTWRDNVEEWQKVGSDRPYHYLGSAIWYTRIGHAAGEAMLKLLDR